MTATVFEEDIDVGMTATVFEEDIDVDKYAHSVDELANRITSLPCVERYSTHSVISAVHTSH